MNLKNIPIYVLIGLVGRILVFGASIGDSIALSALAALYGFSCWVEANKVEPVNENFEKRLTLVENNISGLKIAKTFISR